MSDFQNPVSYDTAYGNCKNEVSCWTTAEVPTSCDRTAAPPAECVRDWSDTWVSEDVEGLQNYVADGCPSDFWKGPPNCGLGGWSEVEDDWYEDDRYVDDWCETKDDEIITSKSGKDRGRCQSPSAHPQAMC